MPKKQTEKLRPSIVASILRAVHNEPYGSNKIVFSAKSNIRTVAEYCKIMVQKGLLTAEVADGENNQLIVKYRITDKGRAFLPKIEDVIGFLNPPKNGTV